MKLECSGYQRERVFIFSKHSSRGDAPASRVAAGESNDRSALSQKGAGHRASAVRGAAAPSITLPVPMSGRHAFRQQLLGAYLCHHLPADVINHCGRPGTKERNWLLQVPDISDLAPALESAVLASCAATLGRLDRHKSLANESLTQYNKSIRELQRALLHPAIRYQDQTLAAGLALTMYEYTECPNGGVQGYLSHYAGTMELLQRRGPLAHATGLGHSVFRAMRMHTVRTMLAQSFPLPPRPSPAYPQPLHHRAITNRVCSRSSSAASSSDGYPS